MLPTPKKGTPDRYAVKRDYQCCECLAPMSIYANARNHCRNCRQPVCEFCKRLHSFSCIKTEVSPATKHANGQKTRSVKTQPAVGPAEKVQEVEYGCALCDRKEWAAEHGYPKEWEQSRILRDFPLYFCPDHIWLRREVELTLNAAMRQELEVLLPALRKRL